MLVVGVSTVDNTGSNEREMTQDGKSIAEPIANHIGEAGVTIRIQPFLNGYMTIQNVPHIVCDKGHKGRLSASTMLRLAQVTRFMQERGLSEFDLREYNPLR